MAVSIKSEKLVYEVNEKERDGVSGASTDDTSSQASDDNRTLWENAKKYRKIVYVTFSLTSAILLYGYDNVIVATVAGMPEFQRDFGYKVKGKWILPATWLAVWLAASPLGAMLGAMLGGWVQDRIGRRLSLASSSFLSAIGVAVMFVSYIPTSPTSRRALFLVGKLLQGIAIGTNITAAQTYLSEILPPVLRASGMAFFPVFTCLGQLTGALVIYGSLDKKRGYVTAFGSQWPFSFLPIIVAFLIPESPAWYIRKGRHDQAFAAQARLEPLATDTKATIEKLTADIKHEEETAATTSLAQCFNKQNLRRTLIVLWVQSFQAIWGLPLLSKASYFLQVVGMSADKSIIFLIMGIVLGLLGNGVGIWMVARIGRRKLVLSTLSVAAGLWLSMGIANCFTAKAVVWFSAAAMMATVTICGLGVWPAGYAIASETSSLRLRARTQGLGWTVNAFSMAVSGIVLPYMYNPDAGNLRGKVAFVFAATCLVGVGVSWAVVPEMKGRSVAEVDRMFELGVAARGFEGWRGVVDGEVVVVESGSERDGVLGGGEEKL
ncbi:MFS general substrate transporter [Byssothecium circinans]|uniref:MFS general substrate transporter n=1 Tax=Byssothecium circinans TaxID=147558 RepID=A0A6A5UB44_9PLEO|nr:MFS general substrate transporter [Byssothecium circinans]